MATISFNARTFFDVATGDWSGRSIGASFPVTDNETDAVFDLDDTLVFGGNTGDYIGTMSYLGTTYPVMQNETSLTILGLTATSAQLPDISSFSVTPEAYPPCFLTGTLIATPEGERPVEALRIGDPVITADGRAVPVRWIGRREVSLRFGPAERLRPVRLAAGSLGNDLPARDLMVTADHGMVLDGVICHAGALVNGTSIAYMPRAQLGAAYTVYHVETARHEVILAEGCPAETFVDNAGRRAFDNFAEFSALYGDDPAPVDDLPLPRAHTARQLPPAIRARLGVTSVA